ncbi:inositol-3-phosphate synthase [Conexivisphaera calida]|uniref:Inositol-1-phosphate synthase n=1 Tax=Conexivisphaera calida TaxID=1874277 RepID=A0A4P2VES3_9ARCH|nr:inositol-3-phosphate synthase [Conexivisphaera calida]BBE42507.1 Inositol-1-phosphate synthase [Conexivisphaera calida]
MKIRLAILGQGLVASHFEAGLERLKDGDMKPYGVPLANFPLPYRPEDLEIAVSYDVDNSKVGRSAYDVAMDLMGKEFPVPRGLKDIEVRRGIHMGSARGMPYSATGLEESRGLDAAVGALVDDWRSLGVDVVINVITTESGSAFGSADKLKEAVRSHAPNLTASHVYAYALAEYASARGGASFVNSIPTPLANDEGVIGLYREKGAVVLGDDGATGATPLTADILEHMAERNRKVEFVVQFNIGGNTDFLALTDPGRNSMKELTKSSIVDDILGYDAPHYIRPTGYLEPLGDRKFVAMHLSYLSFNNALDDVYVLARINDSPALAGILVDLARLAKISLDRGVRGTVYQVNAFYMKRPGPLGSQSISKIIAFEGLKKWLGSGS